PGQAAAAAVRTAWLRNGTRDTLDRRGLRHQLRNTALRATRADSADTDGADSDLHPAGTADLQSWQLAWTAALSGAARRRGRGHGIGRPALAAVSVLQQRRS